MILKNENEQVGLERVEQIMEFFFQEKDRKIIFMPQNEREAIILAETTENEVSKLISEAARNPDFFWKCRDIFVCRRNRQGGK